jgi:hypothetical protein
MRGRCVTGRHQIDVDPYCAPAAPEADPTDAAEQRHVVTLDEHDLPPEG